VSDNGTRRYFNLAGVVRDLEHIRATGGTPEGRDLWERYVAIQDEAFAEAVAADDGTTDDEWSDTGDEPGVGTAQSADGTGHGSRPGGDAESIHQVRLELARMASALATLTRPEGGLPPGPHPVDGAGSSAGTVKTVRRSVGGTVNPNEVKEVNAKPSPRKKRRSSKKISR